MSERSLGGTTIQAQRFMDPRVYGFDHRGNRVAIDPTKQLQRSQSERFADIGQHKRRRGRPRGLQLVWTGVKASVLVTLMFGLAAIIAWTTLRLVSGQLGLPMWASGAVAAMGLAGVALAHKAIGPGKLQRVASIPILVRAYLKRNTCPSCAQPLEGLPKDADGCTVCAECGAAWNVSAVVAENPFDGPPKELDRVVPALKLTDLHYWTFQLQMKRDAGELRSEMAAERRKLRRPFIGSVASLGPILLVLVSAGILISGGETFGSGVCIGLFLGVISTPCFYVAHAKEDTTSDVVRDRAAEMIRCGICPCCENELPTEISALLKAKVCSGCGGAWDPSGKVG